MVATSITAAILAALFLTLSMGVIRYRHDQRISLDAHSNPVMQRRTRAFGNFTEYVPLSLILMALIENAGVQVWYLGVMLITARLAHAYAFYQSRGGANHFKWRRIGMGLQLAMIAISAILLLFSQF